MQFRSLSLALAAAVALSTQSQAAVLSFDLSGLQDTFEIAGPVSGGFTFDTESAAFSDVTFTTDVQSYAGATASLFDGVGFGLPTNTFLFETAARTFFFGLDDLNLALGATVTYPFTFAFEAEDVNDDFQIGIDGEFTFFAGDVRVTRLPDPVAPVPLPASLPLMMAGLIGLAAIARRWKTA